MADQYKSLADAVVFALTRGGENIMNNPNQLLSYLADVMDPDCVEMRVLMRLCNNDLLDPYRQSLGKGIDALRGAEARARDYLVSECMIEPNTAARITGGIAAGVARKYQLVPGAGTQQPGARQPVQQQPGQRQVKTQHAQGRGSRGSTGSAGSNGHNQTLLVTPGLQGVTPGSQGSGSAGTRRPSSQGTAPNPNLIDISTAVISPIAPQHFTGRPVTPKPIVIVQGTTIAYGKDYLLTYHGNAGSQTREVEATVTVTGTGAYTGSCTATFKILPPDPKGATSGQTSSKSAIDIATAIVDPLETQRYTGKPLTPKPQVNIGGRQLVNGTDYRLSYSSNVGSGTGTARGTVTITGTGKYTGSKTVAFSIEPGQTQSKPSGKSKVGGCLSVIMGLVMIVYGIIILASSLGYPDENAAELLIGFVITVFGMWLTFAVGVGKMS